ncbi:glycosyltransferase family 2 protein [Desulfovibrio sulfodismutans]|uniref:Glycosyltransferase family 2 protein n=1 Tax=Desulfolutivibrio sulfodismutans TaxID=63561 RepID=A0A7K3NML8_9BACT|nr:glycosyltransferase family 2 protein [Desulfolutivibrio sulfodismutans]NDY56449.1 glycosyltransferase family 2 protein [Desulfolutivibrio sulfodismutans]QLA13791.1 hypothetical protein GD606_16755 [Desulfolutivibrio sulfodismutans DSM 3696]
MSGRNYLGLCAIVKDEHLFLEEFVAYHQAIGFETFILYDNESAIPVAHTLRAQVERGLVRVVPVRGESMQMPCYTHCLETFRDQAAFLAFLDADEFMVLKKHADARLCVLDYEKHPGLAMHWVTYGSSGHLGRPGGLVLDTYTQALAGNVQNNHHVKCIVNTALAVAARDPHQFVFREPGMCCVDERGMPVTSALSPFCADVVQVNHYSFKSQEDYEAKMNRGRADVAALCGARTLDQFYAQAAAPIVSAPVLSRRMAARIKRAVDTGTPFCGIETDAACLAAADEAVLSRAAGRLLAEKKAAAAAVSLLARRCAGDGAWTTTGLLALACATLGMRERAVDLCRELLVREPSTRSHFLHFQVLLVLGDRAAAAAVGRYVKYACELFGAEASPQYAELRAMDAREGLGVWTRER